MSAFRTFEVDKKKKKKAFLNTEQNSQTNLLVQLGTTHEELQNTEYPGSFNFQLCRNGTTVVTKAEMQSNKNRFNTIPHTQEHCHPAQDLTKFRAAPEVTTAPPPSASKSCKNKIIMKRKKNIANAHET